MKRTGFDAIVITGRAAEPVYLKVTEAGAALVPARALWGLSTRDTVLAVQGVEGDAADVMAIGPAGERLVRFAAMGTYWKNREGFAGRGGIAAVLGSKNVKAVVSRARARPSSPTRPASRSSSRSAASPSRPARRR